MRAKLYKYVPLTCVYLLFIALVGVASSEKRTTQFLDLQTTSKTDPVEISRLDQMEMPKQLALEVTDQPPTLRLISQHSYILKVKPPSIEAKLRDISLVKTSKHRTTILDDFHIVRIKQDDRRFNLNLRISKDNDSLNVDTYPNFRTNGVLMLKEGE